MSRVVGVKIGTKSPHTKDKIYYYKTDKILKKGEIIDIKVETGGTPTATIVVQNSKKKFSQQLKELEINNKKW